MVAISNVLRAQAGVVSGAHSGSVAMRRSETMGEGVSGGRGQDRQSGLSGEAGNVEF